MASHRMQFIIKSLEKVNMIKMSDQRNSKVLDGVKVLDVGCGVGLATEKLAFHGADVTGIDPTAAVIEAAKKQLMASSNGRYLISTIEEHVKQNNEKYDALIVFFVLAHIRNHQQFLNDCCDLLKPGGSIFIQNVNKTWENGFKLWWQTYITKIAPKNITLYSTLLNIEDLTVLLRDAGFKVHNIEGIDFTIRCDEAYWTNSHPFCHLIHAIKDN
ncbi:Hexaprenyldihydroxybenzoate methyltransferase, mitochondrial [Chamberlinius hualienensis]